MFSLRSFLGLNFYTSELDKFLASYDQEHPKLSHSQHKEIAKYKKIYALRDHASQQEVKKKFWDKF